MHSALWPRLFLAPVRPRYLSAFHVLTLCARLCACVHALVHASRGELLPWALTWLLMGVSPPVDPSERADGDIIS